MSNEMIKKKTWEEFRATGLFLIINQFLHVFGWAIVYTIDLETKKIINIYPARVKFRGFSEKCTEQAYKDLTIYMNENHKELLKEVIED